MVAGLGQLGGRLIVTLLHCYSSFSLLRNREGWTVTGRTSPIAPQ